MTDEHTERNTCNNIRHHHYEKREVPTLVGAGYGSFMDDDTEFDHKLVLRYNFEKQVGFMQTNIEDVTSYENNGRFSSGGLILQVPSSTCNYAAYLPCSDIVINGETFQAKPTYGISILAFVNILDIKGRHNIFETFGYLNTKNQMHLEVNYGILRWYHRNTDQNSMFEVAGEFVPAKIWTHIAATYNSTTGIAQIFINGLAVNRTASFGKLTKDWSCLAHIGGTCHGKSLMGFIDEFQMFNYALSSEEILEAYKMCLFSSPSNPSALSNKDSIESLDLDTNYFVKKDSIPSNNKYKQSYKN